MLIACSNTVLQHRKQQKLTHITIMTKIRNNQRNASAKKFLSKMHLELGDSGRRSDVIPRGFTSWNEVIPKVTTRRFKLVIPINTSVTGAGTLNYPLNSPRVSGYNPMGFYQMLSWYARYRVKKSACSFQLTNQSGTGVGFIACLQPSVTPAASPTATLPYQMIENPMTNYVWVGNTNSTQGCVKLANECGVADVRGVALGQEEDFFGSNGIPFTTSAFTDYANTTDPKFLYYWNLAYSTPGGAPAIAITGYVELDYEIEFSDRFMVQN